MLDAVCTGLNPSAVISQLAEKHDVSRLIVCLFLKISFSFWGLICLNTVARRLELLIPKRSGSLFLKQDSSGSAKTVTD